MTNELEYVAFVDSTVYGKGRNVETIFTNVREQYGYSCADELIFMLKTAFEARLYKEALDIQDASNISGVASTLFEVCCALNGLLGDTELVKQHPAVQLIVLKLADMCEVNSKKYDELLTQCRKYVSNNTDYKYIRVSANILSVIQ